MLALKALTIVSICLVRLVPLTATWSVVTCLPTVGVQPTSLVNLVEVVSLSLMKDDTSCTNLF